MNEDQPTFEEAEAAVWWELFKQELPKEELMEFILNTIRCFDRDRLYETIDDLNMKAFFTDYFKDDYNDWLDEKRHKHGDTS